MTIRWYEKLLGPEVPYLNAIGLLMYLSNNTMPNIAFVVSMLAKFSSYPTWRYYNGIKQVLFLYIYGTIDMGLLYRP